MTLCITSVEQGDALTISEFNLGYLVAIIEGEGNLTLSVELEKRGKNRLQIRPQLIIEVTEKEIIIKCHEILRYGFYFPPKLCKGYIYKKRKQSFRLVIGTRSSLLEVLELIEPRMFSEGKKQQAQLLMEFIKSRIIRKRNMGGRVLPYSPREIEIYEEIKKYHTKGRKARTWEQWQEVLKNEIKRNRGMEDDSCEKFNLQGFDKVQRRL